MSSIAFDPLPFVPRLKKAGVNELEAESIAEAVRDVQGMLVLRLKRIWL